MSNIAQNKKAGKYSKSPKCIPNHEHCIGCEDDFYNNENPLGTQKCWYFDGATLSLRKKVHINDAPPWDVNEVILLPSCYHQKRYIFVSPDRTC